MQDFYLFLAARKLFAISAMGVGPGHGPAVMISGRFRLSDTTYVSGSVSGFLMLVDCELYKYHCHCLVSHVCS